MASESEKSSHSQSSNPSKDVGNSKGKKRNPNSKNPQPQKKRRLREASEGKKKRSWVWSHFKIVHKPLMVANEEGVKVEVGKTTRAECSARNVREGQKHFAVDLEGKDVVVTHWTQENCTNAAVEMIVIDEMPFSAIEKSGFRRFCAVAVPKWQIPCRKVVVKSFLTYELKLAFDRLAEEDSKYKGYFDEDEDDENDEDDVTDLIFGTEGAEGEKRKRKNRGKKRAGPPNEEDWFNLGRWFVKQLPELKGSSGSSAEPGERRSDENEFIGQPDMKAALVGVAVNGDGSNSQSPGGADKSARDFASVRDQYLPDSSA
ncbi:Unknown protein [Striga hermonthica]|uniref:Uncharacterized protein n=1 Tax=Striga hermonthica TaxID=68872 RepID=A0A9N7NCU3_STRHE|nr:Unknown protein [Striga hermonthica]